MTNLNTRYEFLTDDKLVSMYGVDASLLRWKGGYFVGMFVPVESSDTDNPTTTKAKVKKLQR